MDEALELGEYLPQSFANANEATYLEFLWSAFETNYREGRYEFASLAFHLLYMSFVSFSIWQIRLARPEPFSMALVGFRSEDEGKLLECASPFQFYDKLKESQIFRFLKLIGCDNAQVGEFSKFVKRRNKIAHPSGSVFFNDQAAIDREIIEIMREVRNIESHMEGVITELYRSFLAESGGADELQYVTLEDELTANFVHKNYMSSKDINLCRTLDIGQLGDEVGFETMHGLHEVLGALYPLDTDAVEA